uniref:Uncharacterized protein n=1 Tax=Daphnia galeata TaxID=27404 RepID=A0A8J2RA38_9CRUS|nr:unnamed protein product [Daphnia galeata]
MKKFFDVFRWIALCSMLLFVFFSFKTVSSASLKGDNHSLTAQSLNGVQSNAELRSEGNNKMTTTSSSSTTTQPRNKSLSRRARIHYRIG